MLHVTLEHRIGRETVGNERGDVYCKRHNNKYFLMGYRQDFQLFKMLHGAFFKTDKTSISVDFQISCLCISTFVPAAVKLTWRTPLLIHLLHASSPSHLISPFHPHVTLHLLLPEIHHKFVYSQPLMDHQHPPI